MIKEIKFVDLYDFKKDYLVFQGCGEDLQEWIDGISNLMVEEKCAEKGYRPSEVYHFKFKDVSNLMISLDNLDISRLCILRLRLRQVFGAMWLSDYIVNI